MTEIDEIIPLIEYDIEEGNHISWYRAKVLLEHISSLITTIESQKEEITGLMDALDDSTKIMKWQQVELKKCREVIARFNQATIQLYQGYGEQELKIMVLTNEIESLKAITGLSVKGLERIAEHDKEIGCYTSVAMVALSEIERLSQ